MNLRAKTLVAVALLAGLALATAPTYRPISTGQVGPAPDGTYVGKVYASAPAIVDGQPQPCWNVMTSEGMITVFENDLTWLDIHFLADAANQSPPGTVEVKVTNGSARQGITPK